MPVSSAASEIQLKEMNSLQKEFFVDTLSSRRQVNQIQKWDLEVMKETLLAFEPDDVDKHRELLPPPLDAQKRKYIMRIQNIRIWLFIYWIFDIALFLYNSSKPSPLRHFFSSYSYEMILLKCFEFLYLLLNPIIITIGFWGIYYYAAIPFEIWLVINALCKTMYRLGLEISETYFRCKNLREYYSSKMMNMMMNNSAAGALTKPNNSTSSMLKGSSSLSISDTAQIPASHSPRIWPVIGSSIVFSTFLLIVALSLGLYGRRFSKSCRTFTVEEIFRLKYNKTLK